ncbi:MAG TPA: SgcJ/EcaC family oxidoreductase [Gemmataceae bacterium]|nr:SgcJ/EcaC family oxidoreductase [Gemmataceae bacterium]
MSKKRLLVAAVTIAIAAAGIGTILAWQAPSVPPVIFAEEGQKDETPDEAAIRKSAADFTKAFDAGDAKAVAAMWIKDGEFQQADGDTLKGRDAIQKDFAEFFKNNPKAKIEIKSESLRVLGKNVAIEEGISRVRLPDSKEVGESRFSILHVREGNVWRMASVREWVPDASESASLADLAWLIGDWTAKGKENVVNITYKWDEDKTSIRGHFTITQDGKVDSTGSHIIVRDPIRGVRAITIDKNGTFGEAFWWQDDGKWIIEAVGSLPNGSQLTAMNVIVPINNDSFTFQSMDRMIGETELPDTPPVRVTRVKK